MTGNDDIRFWSARRACQAIAGGEISSHDYTTELLSACRNNADLNAFITLDRDRALRCASERDQAVTRGPLHGLPIAVKDAIGTRDLPTTAGTPALGNHRPERDADVLQPLTAAGAFVLGKLNLHELSYGITSNNGHTGAVKNPHDRQRIPGGSSGGAGAAVATGMAPAAIGTDTGGSVRIPAALCGVVGFRPTTGRYSQRGIVPVSHTRDTAGPLCRSVDDAAMIDAIIAGEADLLEPLTPSQVRIGLPNQYFLDALDSETRAVFEARIEDLNTSGWVLEEIDIEGLEPPTESCGFPIAVYESKGDLEAYLTEFAPQGPTLAELVGKIANPDVQGLLAGLLAPEFEDMAGVYQDAITSRRPKLQAQLAECFASNRLDAILFPTTPLPAIKIGEDETTALNGQTVPVFPTFIHNTDPASIAGIPGISVPAGQTSTGLPIGIELDGPAGSDRHLLAVAALLEKSMPPATHPE